jgi:hypothetical protein
MCARATWAPCELRDLEPGKLILGQTAGKSQIRILSFDGGADRWLSVTPVNKIVCLHEPEIASVTDAMFSVQ